MELKGKIVDVVKGEIFSGKIIIINGKISEIIKEENNSQQFILPGLIDAHVHIESSMLIPSEFAKIAVTHGTTATVSDPHEIANVLGVEGVNFMINNGNSVPFKFYFGAPSCVPATPFESSGANFGVEETESLMKREEIKYLAEMMNFPGVLYDDKVVLEKLNIAKKYNKPVDGHAPGLFGDSAKKYASAGITTDHECFTMEEALDKIKYGIKVQIREGSAARNYEALSDLLKTHPDMVMLCSDDKHPDELLKGHINLLVKRAINKGYDPINVLRSCTLIPKNHYNLETGLLQLGDAADILVVDNLNDFNIKQTIINGDLVAENGKCLFETDEVNPINIFNAQPIVVEDLIVKPESEEIRVIRALDGELITTEIIAKAKVVNGNIVSDIENDILKIVVLNRYEKSKPSIAFINNFGLKEGAIASTVAHDSHNIIALGSNDEDIKNAINTIISTKGGIVCANNGDIEVLELPVAGIMSNENGHKVAGKYDLIDKKAKQFGCKLKAPFMSLSFMALLVIPALKISDKGLFNGNDFQFTNIFTK